MADGYEWSLGSFIAKAVSLSLEFPEISARKHVFRTENDIEVTYPIRFFEERSLWSGGGVMGSPRVEAAVHDQPDLDVRARIHGPLYRDEGRRCALIDLGRRVPAGTRLHLVVETLFVDEAGTFQPYLARTVKPGQHSGDAGLDALELSVSVRPEVAEVASFYYSHVDPDGIIHEEEVTPVEETAGLMRAARRLESPDIGKHVISWTKNAEMIKSK